MEFSYFFVSIFVVGSADRALNNVSTPNAFGVQIPPDLIDGIFT